MTTIERWLVNGLVVLGIATSAGLIGLSAVLNYRIGYQAAAMPLDGYLYGGAAALADGLKALSPFAAAWAWRNRDWLAVGAAAMAFAVISAYTFTAEVGFAAHHRATRDAGRQHFTDLRADLLTRLREAEAARTTLGQVRTPGEVDAEIARHMKRPVGANWTVEEASGGCRTVRRETRDACDRIANLREERERSLAANALGSAIAEVRNRLERLPVDTRLPVDPQLDAMTTLAGVLKLSPTRPQAETMLAILVGMFIEIGSGLGLYIATTPWRTRTERGRGGEGRRLRFNPRVRKRTGDVETFMVECVHPAPGARLSDTELREAYMAWCESTRRQPMSEAAFVASMARLAQEIGLRREAESYLDASIA